MEYLKKIIKEELNRVLSESYFADQPQESEINTNLSSKDNIIYNFELGRTFATKNLQVDIFNLNRYDFVDYLPYSETEEAWGFDFDTVLGGLLTIDIKKTIKNNSTFWSILFGIKYKNEDYPTIRSQIKNVEGYEKFIKEVNESLSSIIDPSMY